MHIHTIRTRRKGKVYKSHLLRQSYREGGKVKKHTLAVLSALPEPVIELLKRALRGETVDVTAPWNVTIQTSRMHGAVAAVVGMMRSVGLDRAISARKRIERQRILALVAARVLCQGSRDYARRWWAMTTLPELLELDEESQKVNRLYEAMDWLLARQEVIEQTLSKRHLKDGCLVLYDVSSSYVEGKKYPLAAFGYSRDGRKGKRQITYGLVTNAEGCPVAIEVFEGNPRDCTTLSDQMDRLRKRFRLSRVVWVGDRGMIVKAGIEKLQEAGYSWITALRASQIRELRERGSFQPSLFDQKGIAEITDPEYPGERLIICFNPLVWDERRRKRDELLEQTERALRRIETQVRNGRVRRGETIARKVGSVINRWKVGKHFSVEIRDRYFSFARKEDSIAAEAELDGFYILRTNVPQEEMKREGVQEVYKSLGQVEQAFRAMNTMQLELRPIFHRRADRVRAHAFLCMLAYYVVWHMRKRLQRLLAKKTKDSGRSRDSFRSLLWELSSLQRHTLAFGDHKFEKLTTPFKRHEEIFRALNLPLK